MVSAGVVGAVLARLGGFAADQLVEIAPVAAGRLLLVQQREVRFVEFLEELLPRDFLERGMLRMRRFGKFDADDAGVILIVGPAHGRRSPAALFGPVADLVVVGR